MKNSTQLLLRGVKLFVLLLLVEFSSTISAGTFYVRPANDATSWSAMSGITAQQILTSNVVAIDSLNTYYFAKGTYMLSATAIDPATSATVPVAPILTTGKIYGGFKGNETAINLANRELDDKDLNGIVEPWEFKNETIIKGEVPFTDLAGSNRRMLLLKGGEVDGVTFSNFFYYGDTPTTAGSGAIILGFPTSFPVSSINVEQYAGKLTKCTVRQIRTGGCGPIMTTNKDAQVDQCLIEECVAENLLVNIGGGAVYMNTVGGKVTNSVIRNCESKYGTTGTGKGGAIWGNTGTFNDASLIDNNMLIYNCLIYNNTSAQFGVVRLDGWSLSGQTAKKTKSASVINCTIVNNKTLTTTSAQLELVFYGGSAVNCIVLNAPAGTGPFDIRFQSPLCLFSNSVYGAHTGTVSFSATADNVVAGKSIKDLKFVRPLYQLGAAGSADNNPFFDKELFDSIRTANFKIASAESPAVTTPGALVLPATIPASANETLPIPVVGSIPTTDMLGVSRATTNTIGAYQFSGASALRNNYENKTLQVITLPNSILINNQQGKEVVLYSMSGQMLHKQLLKSNNEIIHLNTGFYVVAVDKLVNRVIIK